jgi:arginine decarboxylase
MARFNDAFMMHTSTSPQWHHRVLRRRRGDDGAAGGRALVQETIDEARGFRRAMTA